MHPCYDLIVESVQSDAYWSVLVLMVWNTLPDSFNTPPNPVKDLYKMYWCSFKNIWTNVGMFGFGTSASDMSTFSPSIRALILSS